MMIMPALPLLECVTPAHCPKQPSVPGPAPFCPYLPDIMLKCSIGSAAAASGCLRRESGFRFELVADLDHVASTWSYKQSLVGMLPLSQ